MIAVQETDHFGKASVIGAPASRPVETTVGPKLPDRGSGGQHTQLQTEIRMVSGEFE